MAFSTFNSFSSFVKTSSVNLIVETISLQIDFMLAVGGGDPSNKYIIQSIDNGNTWTNNESGNLALLNKANNNIGMEVIYDSKNKLWMVIVGNGYMSSNDDGKTWITDISHPFNIFSMNTNGNIYIYCGTNYSKGTIWYSYDLLTFTNSNSYDLMGNNCNATIYDGYKWIAVGNGGGGKYNVITSNDGVTWVYNGNGTDKLITQIFVIAYNYSISNPIYLVGGDKGSETILYSSDGLNWVPTTNGTGFMQQLYGIGYNKTNQWLAIGVASDLTGVVMYSSDGMNWIKSITGSNYMNGFNTSNSAIPIGTVSWINDKWFVGGCSTIADIITSTDGINWTANDNIFNKAGFGCRSIASRPAIA